MSKLIKFVAVIFFVSVLSNSNCFAGCLGRTSSSSYPGALDTSTAPLTVNDYVTEDIPNGQNDAIVKIETELGVNPKGSYADLVARLQALMTNPALSPLDMKGFAIIGSSIIYVIGASTINHTTILPSETYQYGQKGLVFKPDYSSSVNARALTGMTFIGDEDVSGLVNGSAGLYFFRTGAGDANIGMWIGGIECFRLNGLKEWHIVLSSHTGNFYPEFLIEDGFKSKKYFSIHDEGAGATENYVMTTSCPFVVHSDTASYKSHPTYFSDTSFIDKKYLADMTKLKIGMSTDLRVSSGVAPLLINFDTLYSSFSDTNAEYNTSTKKFIAKYDGYCFVDVDIAGDALIDGVWQVYIKTNNGTVVESSKYRNGTIYGAKISEFIHLAPGDNFYCEVARTDTNGGVIYLASGMSASLCSNLTIYRIP